MAKRVLAIGIDPASADYFPYARRWMGSVAPRLRRHGVTHQSRNTGDCAGPNPRLTL